MIPRKNYLALIGGKQKISKIIFGVENMPMLIYNLVIYPRGFGGQRILNNKNSFWLDGARPANTYMWKLLNGMLEQCKIQQ